MPTKSRRDWMLDPKYRMQPEHDLIDQIAAWLAEAGWRESPDRSLEHAMRSRTDLVMETENERVLVNAKKRGKGELGRVAVETYPAGYRIYLSEQPDGAWRIRTESNTYDPRPLSGPTVRQVLSEMLGHA